METDNDESTDPANRHQPLKSHDDPMEFSSKTPASDQNFEDACTLMAYQTASFLLLKGTAEQQESQDELNRLIPKLSKTIDHLKLYNFGIHGFLCIKIMVVHHFIAWTTPANLSDADWDTFSRNLNADSILVSFENELLETLDPMQGKPVDAFRTGLLLLCKALAKLSHATVRATFENGSQDTNKKNEETMRWIRELFGELMRQDLDFACVLLYDATVASLDVWEQVLPGINRKGVIESLSPLFEQLVEQTSG